MNSLTALFLSLLLLPLASHSQYTLSDDTAIDKLLPGSGLKFLQDLRFPPNEVAVTYSGGHPYVGDVGQELASRCVLKVKTAAGSARTVPATCERGSAFFPFNGAGLYELQEGQRDKEGALRQLWKTTLSLHDSTFPTITCFQRGRPMNIADLKTAVANHFELVQGPIETKELAPENVLTAEGFMQALRNPAAAATAMTVAKTPGGGYGSLAKAPCTAGCCLL